MNKAEQAILNARTPEGYVDSSIKSKLLPAQKAQLAREWMKKTGFTREEILYARNRHPYWKRKKMENSDVRSRRRLAENDFSSGTPLIWTDALVGAFLSLNGLDKNGDYETCDRDLARHFKTTIPSIQYMRRKFRAIKRMLGERIPRAKFIDFLGRSESLLKKGVRAVESYKTREAALKAKTPVRAKVTVKRVSTGKKKVTLKKKVKPVARKKTAAKGKRFS